MFNNHRERSPRVNTAPAEKPVDIWKEGGMDEPNPDDPVDSAIRALPQSTAKRLIKLFNDGAMRKSDLDVKSVMILAALQEPLQGKVMGHLEGERVFLSNSRSKAGFLVSACEKAKQGALDVRGFGAIDPWKAHLNAKSQGRRQSSYGLAIDLKPEEEFLKKLQGIPEDDTLPDECDSRVKLTINCKNDPNAGQQTVNLEVPYTSTIEDIKIKLTENGVTWKQNKIKLRDNNLGYLKNPYTLAYYNVKSEINLTIEERDRGGVKFKKDQSKKR